MTFEDSKMRDVELCGLTLYEIEATSETVCNEFNPVIWPTAIQKASSNTPSLVDARYFSEPLLVCFGVLMSIEEAADYLGYSVSGIRKLVRKGGLRYFQASKGACLKFTEEWLDEYIEAHSTPDPEPVAKLKRKRATAARPSLTEDFWAY